MSTQVLTKIGCVYPSQDELRNLIRDLENEEELDLLMEYDDDAEVEVDDLIEAQVGDLEQ